MPSRFVPPLAIACSLGLVPGAFAADEAKPKINYKDDVSTVFQTHCNACHNLDKKKGGLVLENYSSLMQGGGSGSVVEPGDPDNSRLFLVVNHDEEPSMPPNSSKIPDKDIALIRKWIEAGAPETSGSVVVMNEKPKLDFKLDPAAMGKPQGEPAMPKGVPTEPVVVTDRPNAIFAMASSPWAPLVAIGQHHQIVLYNSKTQRLAAVFPFPEGTVASLKFSRDGEILLVGGGRGGQLGRAVGYSVKTGERLFEVGQEYDTVLSADLSPDRSLVALGGPSKVLRVYNTSDGSLVYENKKHTEWVTSVSFSPDGVLLASGDRNGGLVVWEALTGREFYDLRGHKGMITDLSWRPDSNVLASSSEDNSIKLWEMQKGEQLKSWNAHGGGTQSVRFAKDGRLVSTGRDRVAKLWDQNGKQVRQFEKFPDLALQADFTLDDQAIVAGDFSGQVRLFNAADGKPLGDLRANPESVATRLETTRKALASAALKAKTAQAELDALKNQVKSKTEAMAKAEAALKKAKADEDAARKALTAKSPAAQVLIDQAKTLQAEVESLAAEKAHAQAAQSASAKADNR
jgi:WD40 repeat protein